MTKPQFSRCSRRALALASITACVLTSFEAIAQQDVFPSASVSDANDIRVIWRVKRSERAAGARGSVVALVDTGANINHVDLVGRIAPGAWSAFNNAGTVTDNVGHGTLVGSIIISAQSGIASNYLPTVMPVQVFNASSGSSSIVAAGVQYAIGRAPIVNLSLGASGAFGESVFRDAVAAGQLLVAAAGNGSAANPEWPARFARETWANGQIIAVGAVDSANQIASFSNRAGDTAAYYLVAPGVNISGAYAFDNSSHASMTGTSAATPQVSAAAAIVRAYWPYLTAAQIARILFATATDLGASGVDEIYGNGLLNLSRALEPVGSLSVPLASGKAVPVSDVGLNPGIASGAAIRNAAASGQLQGIGLDSFGRQFSVDLGQGVAPAPRLTLDQLFGHVDRSLAFGVASMPNGGKLVYALDQATQLTAGPLQAYEMRDRAQHALAGFSYAQPLAGGGEWSVGALGFAHTFFGASALIGGEAKLAASPALTNPYFSLVPSHSHIGFGSTLGGGFQLKYGVLTSLGNEAMLTQFGLTERPRTQATMGVLEVSRTSEHGSIGIATGYLRETSSYLGATSAEAFAIRSHPGTTTLALQAAWRVAPDWLIAGHYTTGVTSEMKNGGDSLIGSVSASRSNGFALGLIRNAAWRDGDRLSLTLSQPLRTISGTMQLDIPTDVDMNGNVVRSTQAVDLRPTARERLTDLTYFRPLDRSSGLGVSFLFRLHPNHDERAAPERIVALRYSKSF